MIDLDDAIDVREVRNIKLANQLLKIKRKAKQIRDQQMAEQNIQAQAQANAQAQQAAAQAEIQKNQAEAEIESEVERTKNELKIQYLLEEAKVKKELMAFEFNLSSKTQELEMQNNNALEGMRESGKDRREKMKMRNQRKIEQQRNSAKSVKRFESSGNDIVTGAAGIDRF